VQLQLANQSFRFSEGIAKDIMVNIRDHFVPANFMILNIGGEDDIHLILGRPFLNTTSAIIYMRSGEIHFQFPEEKVRCYFNSYTTYEKPRKNRSRRRCSQRQRKQIINDGRIVENTPEEEVVPVATKSTEEPQKNEL
jgi:hypothetical protein